MYVWYDIVSVGFTCSATLPGMWERTITVGSAGKTFHATGWKVSCFFCYEGCSKLDQMITMFFALYSHPSLSLSLSLFISPPPSLSTCPYYLLSILFPSPLLLFPSLLPPPHTPTDRVGHCPLLLHQADARVSHQHQLHLQHSHPGGHRSRPGDRDAENGTTRELPSSNCQHPAEKERRDCGRIEGGWDGTNCARGWIFHSGRH